MTRERKIPTILKPTIDEETALRFASAGSTAASGFPADKLQPEKLRQSVSKKGLDAPVDKDTKQITLTIKKDLYDRIVKEAARKDRTVEEHLKKHLTKRYGK